MMQLVAFLLLFPLLVLFLLTVALMGALNSPGFLLLVLVVVATNIYRRRVTHV